MAILGAEEDSAVVCAHDFVDSDIVRRSRELRIEHLDLARKAL